MLKNSRQLSWSSQLLSRPSRLCRVGISSSNSSGIALIQPREAATGAKPALRPSLIYCVNAVVSFKLFFTTDGNDVGNDLVPAATAADRLSLETTHNDKPRPDILTFYERTDRSEAVYGWTDRFFMIVRTASRRLQTAIAFGFVIACVRVLCAQVQQVWDARYNGAFGGQAYAMVLDSAANVYVTGGANGTNGNYDFATVKYDSNGNQLWVACCAAGPDSEAHAIALDDNRNVHVTGWSRGASNNFDYVTVKYDADGHELWVARYDGPVSGADFAQALAVDGFGNVYVTGYSLGTTNRGDYDYATLKYDPGGRQLWVVRYDGSAHDDDEASALALDTAGNVYVTGFSWGPDSKDYATVKYDPNGNQLWAKRHPDGNANAIKVDKAGNVY